MKIVPNKSDRPQWMMIQKERAKKTLNTFSRISHICYHAAKCTARSKDRHLERYQYNTQRVCTCHWNGMKRILVHNNDCDDGCLCVYLQKKAVRKRSYTREITQLHHPNWFGLSVDRFAMNVYLFFFFLFIVDQPRNDKTAYFKWRKDSTLELRRCICVYQCKLAICISSNHVLLSNAK